MMAYALMLAATSVIATGTVMHVLFDLPFWAAVCSAAAWSSSIRRWAACGR